MYYYTYDNHMIQGSSVKTEENRKGGNVIIRSVEESQ